MSFLATTLKTKVDTRVEAPDLVMSTAAILLVTDCEPAYRQDASQRTSTGVCRISPSPFSGRVITPGMHICTLYVQTRQCARSERDSFAVCWQLACIFRLTAWSHSPEMTLAHPATRPIQLLAHSCGCTPLALGRSPFKDGEPCQRQRDRS
jgi:hypothetical protein